MPTSQLELLLQRILHLREPLVGSLHWTVFHFTTEQGELKETTLYIIREMSTEKQTMALLSVQLVAPLAHPPSLAFSQSLNQVLSIKHHNVRGKVIYREGKYIIQTLLNWAKRGNMYCRSFKEGFWSRNFFA